MHGYPVILQYKIITNINIRITFYSQKWHHSCQYLHPLLHEPENILLLIVMTMFKTGTTYMSTFFLVKVRNGIVRDMRNQMYRKILTLPIGFFTNERKGDIMARISGDVTEVQTSVMASLDMPF